MDYRIILIDCTIIIVTFFVIWKINKGKEQKLLDVVAKKWNKIPAQLLVCEMEEIRRNRYSSYKLNIRYTYSVDSIDYQGDVVCFNYCKGVRNEHELLYTKLYKVNQINVWVNPKNYSESVLINYNFEKYERFLEKVGLIFGAIILFIIFYSILGYLYDASLINQLIK